MDFPSHSKRASILMLLAKRFGSRPSTFIPGRSTSYLTRFESWFETVKRTRDADWAGTYHCEVKNLVGGAVSRNVTVSSAYIRKNFLRDPRNGLLLLARWYNSERLPESENFPFLAPELTSLAKSVHFRENCLIGQSLQEFCHRATSDFFQNPPIQIEFILES